jgi:uncharacterized protein YjiK
MFSRSIAIGLVLLASSAAYAGPTSIDLSRYRLTGTFNLPPVDASESSAITYNWNSGNLFVLGDEGEAIVEVTRTGTAVSKMTLTGFQDTEGLTYIGGGRFVLAEERLQDLFVLTYAAGGTVARSSLQSVSLGPTVGNVGIEGVSFDPRTGKFVFVKEKTPQAVGEATADFGAGSALLAALIGDNALGVDDLSDVQVLATVPSLLGTADEENLLIYSQESRKLLEVTRDGTILGEFDFDGISTSAEGVTIDENGVIYITDEGPRVYVLTQIPEPAFAWLAGSGLVALALRRRKPPHA